MTTIEKPIIAAHAGPFGVLLDHRDGSYDSIPFGIFKPPPQNKNVGVVQPYKHGRWTGTTHKCNCHET